MAQTISGNPMKMLFTTTDEVDTVIDIFNDQREVMATDLKLVGTFGKLVALETTVGLLGEGGTNRSPLIRIGTITLDLIPLPDDFADFLLAKHKSYGAEPLIDGGILTLKAKFNMKLARLRNLLVSDQMEETPLDSLKDILGYSVLGYMAHKYWM